MKVMFLPCLVFDSVASGMSPSFIRANWSLIVFGIFVLVVGGVVGRVLAGILRVPNELLPWYVLAVTVPNMIALPLVLVEALCREQHDEKGRVAECVDGATTRLFTVTLTHTILFWTLGYGYVQSFGTPPPNDNAYVNEEPDEHCRPAVEVQHVQPADNENIPLNVAIGNGTDTADADIVVPPPVATVRGVDGMHSKNECCRNVIGALLDPPVVANLVGVVVALSPLLKGLLYGHGAPLSIMSSAFRVVATASPAVSNVITGGSFGVQLLNYRRDDPFGLSALGMSGKAMLGLVIGRSAFELSLRFSGSVVDS
eukprot:TRINITY_DN10603_c0_g1_i1.p1 TRINITY_DN10603_c0_g1~~TRINITY_DN10603_c0_g1_i1.p1  ORF type:complete len:313 (+),score=27.19 TRINITY_DN10603_c0_g1_i1:180-1118(+)